MSKLWLYCLLLPSLHITASQAAPRCPDKPIRLAFYTLGYFYSHNRGFDLDMVNELHRRTSCRFETSVLPRARIWKDLENGRLDMTVSGIETPERRKFALFVPYIQQKNYAIIPKSLHSRFETMEEFAASETRPVWGAIRGFRHGTYYDPWVESLRKFDRIYAVADVNQLFQMLKSNRIQGFFAQPLVYRHKLAEFQLSAQVAIIDWKPAELPVPLGLAFNKEKFSAEEVKAWQVIIEEMKKDGTVKRLIRQYLDDHETEVALVKD